eukprot:2900455-Pleurochrysis_carterae.AAC.2
MRGPTGAWQSEGGERERGREREREGGVRESERASERARERERERERSGRRGGAEERESKEEQRIGGTGAVARASSTGRSGSSLDRYWYSSWPAAKKQAAKAKIEWL